MKRVGVLALQGDVREHRRVLDRLGAEPVEVRRPADLDGIDALVLPGGESTTMALLIEAAGLREPLARLIADDLPVLGTCAGMILLATEVVDGRPDQWSFGRVDLVVRRNGYGRQIDSFESPVLAPSLGVGRLDGVFIRAPVVERVGPGVEVLGRLPSERGGHPVLLREGRAIVASFHPELAGDGRVHALLLDGADGPEDRAGGEGAVEAAVSER